MKVRVWATVRSFSGSPGSTVEELTARQMLADGTSRQDVIDKLLELLTFDGARSNAVIWALVLAEPRGAG
jgi:hypothetical protein